MKNMYKECQNGSFISYKAKRRVEENRRFEQQERDHFESFDCWKDNKEAEDRFERFIEETNLEARQSI